MFYGQISQFLSYFIPSNYQLKENIYIYIYIFIFLHLQLLKSFAF